MAKLLQIDFPFAGPFGDDMAVALRELAESIASEPGFIWKIWKTIRCWKICATC